jgi:small subunit ribosomal protein S8
MSLSDPIADMLTRIRNALRINADKVDIRASNICQGIANVLKQEGYIQDFDRIDDGNQGTLRVILKYDPDGRPAIETIARSSKPGRRLYKPVREIAHVMSGMGITIISTSQGIMSDRQCRQANIGGEIICTVN